MILVLTLAALPTLTQAFFSMGGGCNCAQPACPPAPAPVCAPPPQPVCPPVSPCGGAAVARGAKTHEVMSHVATLPDELELRAAAFGVPLNGPKHSPSNIDQLERLVNRYEPAELPQAADLPLLAEPELQRDDTDLMHAGLRRGAEIRRAPTVIVSHQEDVAATTTEVPTTTVEAATTAPSESSTVKEEQLAQNKCNSQVLHKLMLDNMSDNSSESKRKVNEAAEEKFGGNVDVICSRGHFSYVFSSNLYCEATKGLTTCIAFRQAA